MGDQKTKCTVNAKKEEARKKQARGNARSQ